MAETGSVQSQYARFIERPFCKSETIWAYYMEFEKIGATSLTDTIYKSLLGKILSGEWKPGDWFPAERDIAEQMGVSRSSLHHAVLQCVPLPESSCLYQVRYEHLGQ